MLAFSDGIFAIAMTLLVAGIAIPTVAKEELAGALADDFDAVVSFALSFAVIGFYWIAHHRFFHLLGFIDDGLVRINMLYMCLIAFLPFPTALLGRYDGAPVAVGLYAVTLAAASVVEALMLRRARRIRAFRWPMTDEVYRHLVRAALVPIAVFLASVPLAFAHPAAAMGVWLALFPIERTLARSVPRAPAEYDQA